MSDFTTSRWFANAHAQTFYSAILRFGERSPPSIRRRLELRDGDFIDVDVAAPLRPAESAPWALVLHGLEGCSGSSYVRSLARRLVARGIEACLLNYRGCSGEDNRLARSYHSGATDDVHAAIEKLVAERAGRPFGVVGYSIGANLVMKLLGERTPLPAELRGAVAVSPPFDLVKASASLDGPSNFLYRAHLLRTLRTKALRKLERFPGIADQRAIARATTFAQYDEHFTAPVHGFASARDYWERCSGVRFIAGIERPLLLIAAEDDPFFPRGYVDRAAVAANSRLELLLSPHGGHVGFVGGTPLAPVFWAEDRVADHLERTFRKREGPPVAGGPSTTSSPKVAAQKP
jgi:predicted alpha/beta-fold hydrolase